MPTGTASTERVRYDAVKLRFGTGTTVKNFAAYREWLSVAEGSGFELLTTGDSQSLWADPFVSMTFAAANTVAPRLAITVSNPVTRHPAVVASSVVAIQDVAKGRFCLGLSSGDSALRNIGERPATLVELEAFVETVRAMTLNESVTWNGHEQALRWGSARVPIWIAAEGPRTLQLAGRIADGVVLSNSLTTEAIDRAFTHIRAGAEASGRSMDDIEIWWMVNVVPAETERAGIDSIRSVLAGTANHVYRFTLEGKGLPPERVAAIEELKQTYDSRHHANPATASVNAELVDRLGLTDWLAAQSTIAGPIEHCVERLHEVAERGVRNVILAQFVAEPLAFMRIFDERIRSEFS